MSGDTLWGLSRKYNVTIDSLRAANGLATDTIKPGQNLRIP
jgi:D-gamma-glutamyl-meso-diaminopimelic acid endopeptidase CwlS/peptidoglycan endopeptidase LytE